MTPSGPKTLHSESNKASCDLIGRVSRTVKVYSSPGKSLQIGEWSGQQLPAGEWALDSAKEKPSNGRQAAVQGRGQVRVLYPALTTYECACSGRFVLETDAAHDDDYVQ